MPSRLSRNLSTHFSDIVMMEEEYTNNNTQNTIRLASSVTEETSDKDKQPSTVSRRSLQSPPPLIPYQHYSEKCLGSSPIAGDGDRAPTSLMMRFMTAAAAVAAANSKKDGQTRYSMDSQSGACSTRMSSDFDNMYSARRSSSNVSSMQNVSPSSSNSGGTGLTFGGYEGSGGAAAACKEVTAGPMRVENGGNATESLKPGNKLPLPPGAVPVGTLPPKPPMLRAISPSAFGLFMKFLLLP